MDVTASVRTDRDQYSTLAVTQSSYVNKDQESYKMHEVSFNGDAESGLEKWGKSPLPLEEGMFYINSTFHN